MHVGVGSCGPSSLAKRPRPMGRGLAWVPPVPLGSLSVGDPEGGTADTTIIATLMFPTRQLLCLVFESIIHQIPASTWPGYRGQLSTSPVLTALTV